MGYKNAGHHNMQNRRRAILEKRGNKCEICQFIGYVEIHHIVPVNAGGLDHDKNLLVVCDYCHKRLHGKTRVKKYIDERRRYYKPPFPVWED